MTTLRSCFPSIFVLLVSAQIIRANPDDHEMDAGESTRPPQDVGESSTSKDVVDAANDMDLEDVKKMLESDEDQIVIWKIENGKPVQTELIRAEFESDMTYIIIKGKPKLTSEEWAVFYWIGEKSSNVDASVTASFTVRLDAIVHNTIRVHREYEGLESRTFRKAFKRTEGQNKDEVMSELSTADEEFNADTPRAYLIKKINEEIRFKPVMFSLDYIGEKDICILLITDDVYVYCGQATTEPVKRISKKLGQMILQTRLSDTKLVTLNRSGLPWSQLPQEEQEALENFVEKCDQHFGSEEAHTVDQIFPAKEKSEDLTIIRVHEGDDGVVSYEHIEKGVPTPLSSLKTDDCYVIIITGENAGVLVWMGTKSEIEEREESAKSGELYLKIMNLGQATPMKFVDEETTDVLPEAHLGDFIRFFSHFE